jgi:mannosyltransferase OCH1-like enzyme
MNIPKVLKHIWIGPNLAPFRWMNTWKEKHPDWQYSVFDNAQLQSRTFHNQHLIDEYMDRKLYAGVADLIRYEILYEAGGFIPEADSVCLLNTDPLWVEDSESCYTVYENEKHRPNYVSPIYACNPKNKFLEIIIEHLHQCPAHKLRNKVYVSTGNLFLAEMIKAHRPRIKIFPSHYFIPSHYTAIDEQYTGTDPVYAEQYWGSTFEEGYKKGR